MSLVLLIPQQLEYLWDLKSAVTNSDVATVIVSILEKPLENLELNKFTEDDWKLVQLVFTLFRNILTNIDFNCYNFLYFYFYRLCY